MMDGSTSNLALSLEFLEWSDLYDRLDDWRRLSESCLEPNVFLDPSFALPAAQHLGRARDMMFGVVQDYDGSGGRSGSMLGLWPIAFFEGALARSWLHPFSATGHPLLHRDRATDVIAVFLEGFANHRSQPVGLTIPAIASQGPTARAIRACAARRGLTLLEKNPFLRPVLNFGSGPAAGGEDKVHAGKLARQKRKLAELGSVEFASYSQAADIKSAVEDFLALEALGWKGRRGTALLAEPRHATFMRSMTRTMAKDGNLRIDALKLNGVAIAMIVAVRSGSTGYLWKTAYDETYARFSPGAQLLVAASRNDFCGCPLQSLDSCVTGENPAVFRFWSGRCEMTDFYLSLEGAEEPTFEAQVKKDDFRGRVRSRAKSVYQAAGLAARRRKASARAAAGA